MILLFVIFNFFYHVGTSGEAILANRARPEVSDSRAHLAEPRAYTLLGLFPQPIMVEEWPSQGSRQGPGNLR